jgi:hypothetical protein
MKSQKKLMALSVMAFALFLPGCSESGMRADQDQAEVPAGTQLHVRVNQNMPSGDNEAWKSGDEFQGTLARALEVAGQVIAPEGTIVKGEWTNDLGSGMTGDKATGGDIAGGTGDTRSGSTGATGDPTMSPSGTDRDRMGLELKKIVLNGEEYDIDTHPVPVPGMTAHQSGGAGSTAGSGTSRDRSDTGDRTRDRSGSMTGGSQSGAESGSMAGFQTAGQEFVFTLEDEVELPSTTNMKTE